MLRKLFLSHAVVQVFGGNLDPSLLFPQMSYITSIYPNTHHLFYQNGTGEHVSHISHPLPGRSSMSITRTYRRPAQSKDNIAIWYKLPSQTKSTDHMPSHTSSSYRMPSETSSISHIPSLSDGNHNMHSLTGSLKNRHQLSDSSFNAVNRSSNTPFPPKQSVNKSHFGTYMITYTPSDQSTMRQSLRSGKSLIINPSEDDRHVNKLSDSNTNPTEPKSSDIEQKSTYMADRLYPMSASRSNVKTMSSISGNMDHPGAYDYQSLSRDQVDSHVFSAISHDNMDTDQKYKQTDDSVDDDETKHVIRSNMITHPTISSNMITHPTISSNMITNPTISSNLITHQHIVDTSHSVNEEMVDFKSPMLTNHQSTGSRTSGTPSYNKTCSMQENMTEIKENYKVSLEATLIDIKVFKESEDNSNKDVPESEAQTSEELVEALTATPEINDDTDIQVVPSDGEDVIEYTVVAEDVIPFLTILVAFVAIIVALG